MESTKTKAAAFRFLFRTTVFGQLVRLLSRNKLFQYPDEIDPAVWKRFSLQTAPEQTNHSTEDPGKATQDENGVLKDEAMQRDDEQGVILVDWYGSDDPENPQNWPISWKHAISFQMCILNFAVYIASSIYVPGELGVIQEFGVSDTVATLGLSLFTLGYGIGPMIWSPMSEIPKLGRSGIFFWTLLAFILFQLPVGFAPDIAEFLVFRWLTGFCGSPCLGTGGGTIADMYDPAMVVYMICIWSSAGVCGPVFGPLIGGFLAPAKGWRWTIWVFTWLCSLVLIVMFFFFPETSAANILYNRARRARTATGDNRFRSQSEIDSAEHTAKDHLVLLSMAFRLTFLEPIVLLMDLYMGLLYGVLFIWFESFPIVFGETYGFNTGHQGLVFISIFVFAAITVPLFLLWVRYAVVPQLSKPNFKPEMVLPPAFVGCLVLPICLFWYGWTSQKQTHWIVPTLGAGCFAICIVTLFNSVFNYLGIVYTRQAASVFAGSALFRASFGAVFPLFARSLFRRLGVGAGNSLLGGIAVCFIPIPFIFYRYGEKIRHMSKNAI